MRNVGALAFLILDQGRNTCGHIIKLLEQPGKLRIGGKAFILTRRITHLHLMRKLASSHGVKCTAEPIQWLGNRAHQ